MTSRCLSPVVVTRRERGEYVGGHWMQLIYDAVEYPCGKCKRCRARKRYWFVRWFEQTAQFFGGYVCVLTFTLPTWLGTAEHRFALLHRCRRLFMQRLARQRKWGGQVTVWEARTKDGRDDFPHVMVAFFGWTFLALPIVKALWSAVCAAETGAEANWGAGIYVGRAVAPGEVGRIAPYVVKEIAAYLTKEGRPWWMPPGARQWSKTPRLPIFMHGRRSHPSGVSSTLTGGRGRTLIAGGPIGPLGPSLGHGGPAGQGGGGQGSLWEVLGSPP